MEKLIISLYEKIKANNIRNRLDSLYWIYIVENIIVRENGLSKRYLKILFFNRQFNENGNLMRLYLNINGKVAFQDSFQVVSDYNNQNIMGFIINIDLEEEDKNVEITGYILNGKKIELKEDFIDLNIDFNQEKVNAICEYGGESNTKELITVPQITDNYWLCCCGYINAVNTKICPVCARKQNDLSFFIQFNVEEEVISKIQNRIEVNTQETAEEIKMKYARAVEKKYGIELEKVLLNIDLDKIEQQQTMMIDNQIKEYLKNNKITWNVEENFETNISNYIYPICKGIIKKEDVLKRIDLETEELEYKKAVKYNLKKKKKRKLLVLVISCIFVITLSSILYYNMTKPPIANRDYSKEKNVVRLLEDAYNVMKKEKNYEVNSSINYDCGFERSYSYKSIRTFSEEGNILKYSTYGLYNSEVYDGTSIDYYIEDKKNMKEYHLLDLRNASDSMKSASSMYFSNGAYPDSKLYKMSESELGIDKLDQQVFLESWIDYYSENIDLYSINADKSEQGYIVNITFDSNESNYNMILDEINELNSGEKSIEKIAGVTDFVYDANNYYPELNLRNVQYSAIIELNNDGQITNLKQHFEAIDDGYGFNLNYDEELKFTKYGECTFEKDILNYAVDQSENIIMGKEPDLSDLNN
ncbi:hypothetical protein WKT02_13580 [Erysipelotrichaceae bacterium HCN-30851]